jgi:hypothetical protein
MSTTSAPAGEGRPGPSPGGQCSEAINVLAGIATGSRRKEAARIAIGARLATEDWREMTAKASASPRNPAGLDRWRAMAREHNPA